PSTIFITQTLLLSKMATYTYWSAPRNQLVAPELQSIRDTLKSIYALVPQRNVNANTSELTTLYLNMWRLHYRIKRNNVDTELNQALSDRANLLHSAV
ncbi:hypothetical protein BGZ49_005120, partial [Haplosporangium sp. Z 27]